MSTQVPGGPKAMLQHCPGCNFPLVWDSEAVYSSKALWRSGLAVIIQLMGYDQSRPVTPPELNKSPAMKSVCHHGYQSQRASHHRDGSVSILVKCEEVCFLTIHVSLMSFPCWGASVPLRYKSIQMYIHNRPTEFAISTALHSVFTAAFWLQFSIQYNLTQDTWLCGLEYQTLQTVTSSYLVVNIGGPPGQYVQPPPVQTVQSQGVDWGF